MSYPCISKSQDHSPIRPTHLVIFGSLYSLFSLIIWWWLKQKLFISHTPLAIWEWGPKSHGIQTIYQGSCKWWWRWRSLRGQVIIETTQDGGNILDLTIICDSLVDYIFDDCLDELCIAGGDVRHALDDLMSQCLVCVIAIGGKVSHNWWIIYLVRM